jgi:excinuclease UvrABC nuclease subunit
MDLESDGFDRIGDVLGSGVYALIYRGKVVYIGQSVNMLMRIATHKAVRHRMRNGKVPTWLAKRAIAFDDVWIQPCLPEEMYALERRMIESYRPRYNIHHNSDRHVVRGEIPDDVVPLDVILAKYMKAHNAAPADFIRRD